MFIHGRPRYWIAWYDRWHLLLPLVFAVLVWATWKTHPRGLFEDSPTAATPIRRVVTGDRGVARRMAPTVIDTPRSGTGYTPSQLGTIEGRAEPGSLLLLYYLGATPAWGELGQARTDNAGHFGFRLAGFPTGSYRLRARAQLDSGEFADSADVLITVVEEPAANTRRNTRRARR